MRPLKLQSAGEQAAAHLKEEILSGRLTGSMPGVRTIATKLGINHKTAEAALALLEESGLIRAQGAGRPRRIVPPKQASTPGLNIRILLYEPHDTYANYIVELRHRLTEGGHKVSFAQKSLLELRFDLKRVKKMVRSQPADAWIVVAGSRDILTWFSHTGVPTFALFGNRGDLPLAHTGPSKADASRKAIETLIAKGHRRIVLILRGMPQNPIPGGALSQYLDQLEYNGITPGRYNLPVWEDSPEALHQCLTSLFQHTPPTALLIDDTLIYFAVQNFLHQRNILAPRDISIICMDPHPSFEWCRPTVAHYDYNPLKWVQNVVQWANRAAIGDVTSKKELIEATFVDGASIGPVPE